MPTDGPDRTRIDDSRTDYTRIDYTGDGLADSDVPAAPYPQIDSWLEAATARQAERGDVPEPAALSVATVAEDGTPDVRTVLMRFLDPRGPGFVTCVTSTKGRHLGANPVAAASLTWPSMFRAVRFTGGVERVSEEDVRSYFQARPWASRISAWASRQSEPIGSRGELEDAYRHYAQRYPDRGKADDVPVPDHWGAFRIVPRQVEFWAGRRNRLHDRFLFTRADGGAGGLNDENVWSVQRLQP